MIKHISSSRRSGVILLVVITMLALFATVGLAFVYYASNEADVARIRLSAENAYRADVDAELLLSFFMSQFLYDTDDPYSAMRGHGLNRSLYGFNGATLNTVPFNGTGLLHYPVPHPSGAATDNYFLMNFMYFNSSANNDRLFYRDPECFGTRASGFVAGASYATPIVITSTGHNLTSGTAVKVSGVAGNAAANGTWVVTVIDANSFKLNGSTGSGIHQGGGTWLTATPNAFIGGNNVPWTYPDMQSAFLGAVNANDEVLIPSFSRPWSGVVWDRTNAAAYMNPWNKYLTLRPHGSYHPLFPDSDEGPGAPDVKNLEHSRGTRKPGGGHWMNDSYWMDLGFPVMTAPNGKKFKPLFAPLIIDLDGKVNLAVHGNLKGTTAPNYSLSNQGWSRAEINPQMVLGLGNAKEYQRFMMMNRYGPDSLPSGTVTANNGKAPPYSAFDFDATSSAFQLPTQSSSYANCFPTYPAGFDSGNAAEAVNHPGAWRYFGAPAGDDRPALRDSNIEALVRMRGTGSPAQTSELLKMLPNSLQPSRARSQVTVRSMDLEAPGASPWNFFDAVSSATSFDFKLYNTYNDASVFFNPGKTSPPPFVYSSPYRQWNDGSRVPPPTSAPILSYPYYLGEGWPAALQAFGRVNGLPFPIIAGVPSPNPYPNTEFGPDWRSTLPQFFPPTAGFTIPKLNINGLPDYPPANPKTGFISAADPLLKPAVSARQAMAKSIFDCLIKVTGSMDPRNIAAPVAGYDETVAYDLSFKAARYLAQLAVNIVDYADRDDYITAFPWMTGEVIYGTELPRLLLNEAYVQLDSDPNDLTQTKWNVWVEMHNPLDPLPGTNYPQGTSSAILQKGTIPLYKLVVTTGISADAAFQTKINRGDPTAVLNREVISWGTGIQLEVEPTTAKGEVYGTYKALVGGNKGFYVVGPLPDPAAGKNFVAKADPKLPTTFLSPVLSVPATAIEPGIKPTLLLRRLACPHLMPTQDTNPNPMGTEPAYNNNPASPDYNPYITVDMMENLPVNANNVAPNPAMFASVGRAQPYDGNATLRKLQAPRETKEQPQHTFFYHNAESINYGAKTITAGSKLKSPFDWLVHMDRQLSSPMELLHVSAYAPHFLTKKFVADDGTPYQHLAKWFGTTFYDTASMNYPRQETLLYRLFEMIYTPDVANPTSYRQPGKMNINTIWDRETAQSLLGLTGAQAQAYFPNMVNLRSPGLTGNAPIGPTLDDFPSGPAPGGFALNFPYKSLAAGYSPANPLLPKWPDRIGINSTILRDNGEAWLANGVYSTPVRLFEDTTQSHPYMKYQLLNKIFNNVTTRSNVFAVWLTVGFFEAYDEQNGAITDAFNTPITITSPNHRLLAGDAIRISGVQGNTAANGNWIVANPITANSFSLSGPGNSSNGTFLPGASPPPVWSLPLLPAKLGKEIGRDEGRNVRHRMFAIVDRTQMLVPDYPATTLVGAIAAAPHPQAVMVSPFNFVEIQPPYGAAWQGKLGGGSVVVVDRGKPSEEKVTVREVGNSQIAAIFTQAHAINATVHLYTPSAVPFQVNGVATKLPARINGSPLPVAVDVFYGNPGPQPRFDHRHNTQVVTHYSVIE